MRFANRVAIVTGASQGIGRATAQALAAEGAAVVAVDRNQCSDLVAEIKAAGGVVREVMADVSVSDDVAKYVAVAEREFGRIDILVNNAAIEGPASPLTAYDEAAFDKVLSVNVKGTFLGMKMVLPVMLANGGGAIVNMSSVAGLRGAPSMIGYHTSKHAVLGLTRAASAEFARRGIRVNTVCPGSVNTRMIKSIAEMLNPDDPEAAALSNAEATPTGRYSTVEEVAGLILYLCSDIAANITGAEFVIDGGRSSQVSAFVSTGR